MPQDTGDILRLTQRSLPTIIAVGVTNVPQASIAPYRQSVLELDFFSSGAGTQQINGEIWPASTGAVYITKPDDHFAFESTLKEGPVICRWVKLAWPGWPGESQDPLALPREIRLSPAAQVRYQELFDELLQAYQDAAAGWELTASGGLLTLLGLIRHELAQAKVNGRSQGIDRRLASALRFMERHAARRLFVAEIAKEAGLSEDYFTRLFQKQLKISPLQHLIGLRVTEARRLLTQDPALTIAQASRRVGFEDHKHFMRMFRKRFGVSPQQFRDQLSSPWQR
jgi:AraC-like DNA-binding protein